MIDAALGTTGNPTGSSPPKPRTCVTPLDTLKSRRRQATPALVRRVARSEVDLPVATARPAMWELLIPSSSGAGGLKVAR